MIFLSKELSRLTGLNPRRLLDWTKRGYIVPFEPGGGQGFPNQYDEFDALQALVLEQLTRYGISLKKFSKVFWGFRKSRIVNPLSDRITRWNFRLVIYGECEKVTVYMTSKNASSDSFAKGEEAKLLISNKYEVILTLDLNRLIEKIRHRI